jgi:hypothetical protein
MAYEARRRRRGGGGLWLGFIEVVLAKTLRGKSTRCRAVSSRPALLLLLLKNRVLTRLVSKRHSRKRRRRERRRGRAPGGPNGQFS